MSTPDPKVVALLAEHRFDGWVCACGQYGKGEVKGLSHPQHLAQVLADAGIGDVAAVEVERDEWKRTARHTREWALGEVQAADARVAAVVESVLALADEADARPGGPGCPTPHWVDTDSLRAAVESTDVVASGTQAFSPAVEQGRYVIPYGEMVDGYRHAYRKCSPRGFRSWVVYSRSPSHPADPRCPECHPTDDRPSAKEQP